MISPERHAEIRRLFFAEHWPVNTIAAQLGVHHDTVRRAVESERFIRPGTQVRPSALDPDKTFIVATLEQYPRRRATRRWVMVRDRGYPGSAKQVERYVRTVRPAARAEAYLRLDTLAGEQAQVDWGNFGPIRVGSTTRLLSCFVFVLSWSRACYARFALDQTLESFLRGHVEAFAALQGVPRTILYDNLKSVVLERVGDHIRFHPRVLELAGHYHFAPQPCAVARGNEKEYLEGAWGILRGDLVTVKVVFPKTVARYIKERLWHPSQRFRDLPNGQVEVTLRVADTLEVRRWIQGYGVHAVVLEPTALRDALRDEAEALVRRLTPQRRALAATPRPPARRPARATGPSLATTGTPRRSPVRPSPPQRLPARGRDAMWCPLIGAAVMVPIGEVLDSTSGDRAGPRRRARHRGSGR
jgi:transposase